MSDLGFGGSVAGTLSEMKLDSSISDHSDKNAKRATSGRSSSKKGKTGKGDDSKSTEVVGAKVMLKHGFGSTALHIDGVQSFSTLLGEKDVNDRIMYRVGRHICVFDPESGRQQYFTGRARNVVNALHFSISQNSRYVSICESVRLDKDDPGHSQASIYSLTTFARQKTLTHSSTAEFICSSFCGDSKFLATLSDDSDRLITLWQWEKEKLCKSISVAFKVYSFLF